MNYPYEELTTLKKFLSDWMLVGVSGVDAQRAVAESEPRVDLSMKPLKFHRKLSDFGSQLG